MIFQDSKRKKVVINVKSRFSSDHTEKVKKRNRVAQRKLNGFSNLLEYKVELDVFDMRINTDFIN